MSVPTVPELEADSANPGPKPPLSEGGSLRKLAMKGAIWTILGYGCGQILRLAGNLVLTRLLEPELFGLMALAQTALTGLAMFSDLGTSASIVRHSRGEDPRFLNTAWTLQVIQGFWLFAGTLALAWPVAWIYGDSRLILLLPLAGLNGLLNGFTATAFYVLNRRLNVRTLATFEISNQAISLALMIGFVLIWPTIWSLVFGGIAATFIRVIRTHFLLPEFKNRLEWDRSAFRDLFSFGKWLFLSTAAFFLGEQADRLVLGKLLSFQMLGIYGVAANLADMPRQVERGAQCQGDLSRHFTHEPALARGDARRDLAQSLASADLGGHRCGLDGGTGRYGDPDSVRLALSPSSLDLAASGS